MHTVFTNLKPYRLQITVALFFMLTELSVELMQPLLMAKIIDEGILTKNLGNVYFWGGTMVAISLAAFASGIINSFYASHVSQSTGFEIRQQLYEKIQRFSFSNLASFSTPSLITRLTNDVTQLQNTIFMSLRIMMRAPLLVIGSTVLAFFINVQLALIIAVTIPLLFAFLLWTLKRGSQLFQKVQEKLDQVNTVVRENLTSMRLIKAYVRKDYEERRFTGTSNDLKKNTMNALRLMETIMPVLLFVMNMAILTILWFGSVQVESGTISVGEVVAIVNYGFRITSAFSIFSMIIMVFSRFKASAERISQVLDTEIDIKEQKEENTQSPSAGSIQFANVRFFYPKSNIPALKDVSFTVKQGQTLAILGETGSGKTTLFHLLPRLYDLHKGEITVNRESIKNYSLQEWRQQIGYVPQEIFLFSGTIKENIAWGKENATDEEIIRAAKDAQIHDTIMKFSAQYETILGQKGVNLSGGQKQRLSIARALVRKPKILLLDDSTSALDLATEARLLQALKEYTCTTLIITQKITTAKVADHILLLKDGEIAEQGNHFSLLQSSALYRQICHTQNVSGGLSK
ncbi:ABC transporter ATP-binding protein [Bacillaceae bacterium Marseille-Q3522]|nr:ABC transporter ATP-binding protein [Bacillaceae bacterium Marseille-Q3522]